MRALASRGNGTPAVDMVRVKEPEPQDNEAVVDVAAVAINRGELRLLAKRDRGWRPGQDVAGVISAAAVDGSGPTEGTRVVAWPGQAGWAESVAVPTSHIAVIADSVSFSQAATLPIAGMTALRVLRVGGNLTQKSVLVTGASGGVGRFAIELAAHEAARVVGVSADSDRARGLSELGAAATVNRITDAEGPFDLILESVGGDSLEAAIALVAPQGTVVVFGNSSNTKASVSFADFLGKPGAKIEAFFVYESGETPTFGNDLQLLADLVEDGSLHPQIGLEVPWSELNHALQALQRRQVIGKAVALVQ